VGACDCTVGVAVVVAAPHNGPTAAAVVAVLRGLLQLLPVSSTMFFCLYRRSWVQVSVCRKGRWGRVGETERQKGWKRVCMRIYVHMCMCMCVCVYACAWERLSERKGESVCACVYMYICVCVCVFVYMRVCEREREKERIEVRAHVYVHVCSCICVLGWLCM